MFFECWNFFEVYLSIDGSLEIEWVCGFYFIEGDWGKELIEDELVIYKGKI